jgi:hypothetical protein
MDRTAFASGDPYFIVIHDPATRDLPTQFSMVMELPP